MTAEKQAPEPTKPAPQQPSGQWQFTATDDPEAPLSQPDPDAPKQQLEPIHWTASQFVAHHKSTQWYINLAIATAIVAGLIYLITRGDVVATATVVVAAIFFGISAGRKPRVLEYEVNTKGIAAGKQFFPYSSFKSFSVIEEGAVTGLVFLPLKRFMPALTVYCAPEDEGRIIALLASFLPMQPAKEGPVDRFLQRIRF